MARIETPGELRERGRDVESDNGDVRWMPESHDIIQYLERL